MNRRVILGAALALPALWPARAAALLRIGSKNFTEQLVVAELYAQALEKAGARVERRVNLGGTAIAQQALLAGEIDLYPEYTGTGLGVVLKQPPEGMRRASSPRSAPAMRRWGSTGWSLRGSTTAMRCWCCRRRRKSMGWRRSRTSPVPRRG
ncbi:glycine betaine ABC transporter substrate-binding protein [Paeniroseomonas aquatica]|uniref:glycine betaine ABC transporter substrate-binding protein n=1 Tax=Paeniroseomonas aquatica TaxID=373043 RepID=UPI003620A482